MVTSALAKPSITDLYKVDEQGNIRTYSFTGTDLPSFEIKNNSKLEADRKDPLVWQIGFFQMLYKHILHSHAEGTNLDEFFLDAGVSGQELKKLSFSRGRVEYKDDVIIGQLKLQIKKIEQRTDTGLRETQYGLWFFDGFDSCNMGADALKGEKELELRVSPSFTIEGAIEQAHSSTEIHDILNPPIKEAARDFKEALVGRRGLFLALALSQNRIRYVLTQEHDEELMTRTPMGDGWTDNIDIPLSPEERAVILDTFVESMLAHAAQRVASFEKEVIAKILAAKK